MSQEAANKQNDFIETARRLLKPKEVKLHKVPPWLKKRLNAYGKTQSMRGAYLFLHQIAADIGGEFGAGWLDHWGTSVGGPFVCCNQVKSCFVSEPYEFESESARALDRFCASLGGLTWHVSSNTWWYPSSTVRVTIHE